MNEVAVANSTEMERVKRDAVTAFSTSPIAYCKRISDNISSIKVAVQEGTLTLHELRINCNMEVKAVLVKFIEGMLRYFGFDPYGDASVDDAQVNTLCNDILEKFHYFTIEEVCLCFKKARQNPSKYGKFYGRFDASVVMNWFNLYDHERDHIIESFSSEKFKETANPISREDYILFLQSCLLAGDLTAQHNLDMIEETHRILSNGYEAYKYIREHKYDSKPHPFRK